MESEVSNDYRSTYQRDIKSQIFNDLRYEYEFPRAVCNSLSELFVKYLDLYSGGSGHHGQLYFQAVSKKVPPGVPVKDMHLKLVRLTLYEPDDCKCKSQSDLMDRRINRLTSEALEQGALLTLSDLSVLLGEGMRTVIRHIKKLESSGEFIPTRGKWKDIGPGVSHKKRIVELYLKGYEYTEICRKTKHSSEAIKRYIKEFARIFILSEEGYELSKLRLITNLSEKTLNEYLELVKIYQGEAYKERLDHLRKIFGKKRGTKALPPANQFHMTNS